MKVRRLAGFVLLLTVAAAAAAQDPVLQREDRVPHISLVSREMWEGIPSGAKGGPQAHPDKPFVWNKPAWAPTPLVPGDNPMTTAKVALGRRLFYDKRLSSDHSMSCATCHQQAAAFTDYQRVHLGVTGEPGKRSAMTLTNAAYLSSYTWANPSLTTLEKQLQIPLFADHPIEMNMAGRDPQLLAELASDPNYPDQFAQAFPQDNGSISVRNLTRAIAAFERTLLSFNSPYDRYQHGEPNAISPAAKRGMKLFFGERLECYHCHGGINFTDNHTQQGQAFPEAGFHNTGLYNEDGNGAYKPSDHGLRDVTARPEDEGAFRTPTLRNIAVTRPYMHDGSLATLEQVIRRHYAVKGHSTIAGKGPNPLRSEFIEGFRISNREVNDLIAFLNSLTDTSFLTNPAFADPALADSALADSALADSALADSALADSALADSGQSSPGNLTNQTQNQNTNQSKREKP